MCSFDNDFVIKDGVLIIYKGEDSDVVIPDSVTSIGGGAFSRCTNINIYGHLGSEAERYAKQNEIKFKAIN